MRGGLTIDIYIPKGILQEPGAFTRLHVVSGQQSHRFYALGYVRCDVRVVVVQGTRPRSRQFQSPRCTSRHSGLSPAEAGTLVEDTIHPRDITCTLVDLAVRGYVKIEETVDKGLHLPPQGLYFPSAQAAGPVGK